MIITEKYTKIVEECINLKEINNQTENIYSNITYLTTTIAFQYNEIIEEKDRIILEDISTNYSNHLKSYDDIVENIGHSHTVAEELRLIYNSAITRTYTDKYNEYVDNLQISPEKYNYLANKLQNIAIIYNNAVDIYNTTFIDNISLMNKKTEELDVSIFNFNVVVDTKSTLYSIRLFSILLNVFVKNFRIMSYDEKVQKLAVLKSEYIKYLRNLKKLNKVFIISHLHKIYITPLLLMPNTEKSIILKDNISSESINLSSYYGVISPDFIQFKANILPHDIRSNLLDNSKPLYEIHPYNGNIFFYPDYRNKTYEIEITAYSMLTSQQKYKIILTENGFPAINPIDFGDSNIKLGNINNNTFNLNLRDYYSTSNTLFMIKTRNSIESNLTYDIYTYKTEYIDYCNIPIITDNITITPYIAGGYPVLFEEYSNTNVELDVYSSPKITMSSITFTTEGVSVFECNLTAINEWYINVVEESRITFEYITMPIPRDNLKDPSIPIVEIDSNILKINPDYRGETYNIKVNIESPNDYSLCNIIEIAITEDAVPKPFRTVTNLLLEHLLLKEEIVFNANRYFTSGTGENLKFEYKVLNRIDYKNNNELDTLPYNIFEITTSNLKFTPDYRNIGYTLQIYATDTVYNESSQDVLEINVREDKVLNVQSEISDHTLGNEVVSIDIKNHIEFPERQELRYINNLRYFVYADKELHKSKKNSNDALDIKNGKLYIEPDYRNDSYNVNILVEYYENELFYDNINFTFLVSEQVAPYPKVKNNTVITNVNNSSYDESTNTLYVYTLITTEIRINLDLFFTNDIDYSSNRYEIVEENDQCYIINANLLLIKPNVRDITHKFSIIGIDNIYGIGSNLLNVELVELPPISLENNSNVYNLSNNEIVINLDTVFTSEISSDRLDYYIDIESDNNIRLNVSNSTYSYELNDSILQLYPDYRGISYRLNVTATNSTYITQSLTYHIDINETDRLSIIPKINNIKINMERFKYNSDDICINLEDLFVHFRYYPEYNLILESDDIINFDQYIYISLGYLIISNFTYESNFTIKLILFDTTNKININFVRTVKSLTNKGSEISLGVLNEQYEYQVLGLKLDINSFVQLHDNKIDITATTEEYDFVLNKVHKDLNLIVEQTFYKVVSAIV
tara:strand:+ start:3301 stop:6741 length:3441 start_codon:yes stop_codon:yes gene_type:complete